MKATPVAPVVTDEMVQAALKIACNQRPVGCGDGDTYTVSVPTFFSMRAAITAALEASGELERLRAENEKLRMDRGFAIGWITALANNPYKPMTWMQTREAAADCLAALQGDAP